MRNICTHFIYCDCVSLSTLHCAGPRSTTCSLYTVSLLIGCCSYRKPMQDYFCGV